MVGCDYPRLAIARLAVDNHIRRATDDSVEQNSGEIRHLSSNDLQ